jgi:hypothetical protein
MQVPGGSGKDLADFSSRPVEPAELVRRHVDEPVTPTPEEALP